MGEGIYSFLSEVYDLFSNFWEMEIFSKGRKINSSKNGTIEVLLKCLFFSTRVLILFKENLKTGRKQNNRKDFTLTIDHHSSFLNSSVLLARWKVLKPEIKPKKHAFFLFSPF